MIMMVQQRNIDETALEQMKQEAIDKKNGRYAPSILIGLGGSGAKTLKYLRSLLYERFGTVNQYGKACLPGMALSLLIPILSPYVPMQTKSLNR